MVELHIKYFDEIIKIKRTVLRGQSPYYEIQREKDTKFKKWQATEVQNLVQRFNINPDNHFAFVSQGKIDAIKSLKPIELGHFIEEGIGLKDLRDDILQQKFRVTNLDKELKSMKNKKSALNFNLELLRPKLEKLDKKKELLKIKEKLTDELLWANKEKVRNEISALKDDVKSFKSITLDLKKELEAIQNKINNNQKGLDNIDQDITNHSIQIGKHTEKKDVLTGKVTRWKDEKETLTKEIASLKKKITQLDKILANLNKQNISLKEQDKLIKKEREKIRKQLKDLINERKLLDEKFQQNKEFFEKLNQLEAQKTSLINQIHKNEQEVKQNNLDIADLFQSLEDIDHKLDKNRWFLDNPSKSLLRELDDELRLITQEVHEIDSKIHRKSLEKGKKIKELSQLQSYLRERKVILPANINILKEEINKRDLRVKGPIIEYLKYEDELSYAIESVLGEKLLYSFVASDWDTLILLKRLKDKYNAYCNIYIPKSQNITPLPQLSNEMAIGYLAELIKVMGNDLDIQKVLYSKIKNCVVVKDYRTGQELYKKHRFKGKCVTLKGEQIISYKYAYETPFMKRLKGFLSAGTQKEQILILEKDITEINEDLSEMKVRQSKLDQQQREIFHKKEGFADLLYNFNQKQRLTARKNELYEEIYSLQKSIEDSKLMIRGLDDELGKLEKQIDPEYITWNERLKIIPDEIIACNESLDNWNEKLDENREISKEVDDKILKNQGDRDILQMEYKRLNDEFRKSDTEAFELFRELENVKHEIDVIQEEITHLQQRKSTLKIERKHIDEKFNHIRANLSQYDWKISQKQQEIENKLNDLKRIEAKIGKGKLAEDFKVRSIPEIKNDIINIDKELVKFLDVDDTLLIERDNILSGLKSLSKNQRDLENEINAALKTEKKMEEAYYEKFESSLENLEKEINNKFNSSDIKIYCRLDLSGSFQDLGIEIKAATSKDQLKTCSALSGGQISMISICLILSLQELKPSPLCMFDEAGMFLDDKNSEASYEMIKSTLDENPIQLILFLPKSPSSLYLLADKLIGVARVGKDEVSTIFNPKFVKEASYE